jgi:hypothetical protein
MFDDASESAIERSAHAVATRIAMSLVCTRDVASMSTNCCITRCASSRGSSSRLLLVFFSGRSLISIPSRLAVPLPHDHTLISGQPITYGHAAQAIGSASVRSTPAQRRTAHPRTSDPPAPTSTSPLLHRSRGALRCVSSAAWIVAGRPSVQIVGWLPRRLPLPRADAPWISGRRRAAWRRHPSTRTGTGVVRARQPAWIAMRNRQRCGRTMNLLRSGSRRRVCYRRRQAPATGPGKSGGSKDRRHVRAVREHDRQHIGCRAVLSPGAIVSGLGPYREGSFSVEVPCASASSWVGSLPLARRRWLAMTDSATSTILRLVRRA